MKKDLYQKIEYWTNELLNILKVVINRIMLAKNKYMLILIGIFSLLIIYLVPYCYEIDLGPGPNRFLAILWEYRGLDGFSWFTVFQYVPFYFFRFVALFYVMRYLMGFVSKKKALIMAIISELIPLLFAIPGVLILNSDGENYIPITISIPILLLYYSVLIFSFSNIRVNNKEL